MKKNNNNDFDRIIEYSYFILKSKLKFDDLQAAVFISSILLLPVSYFLGFESNIELFKDLLFVTVIIDICTVVYSFLKIKYFKNRKKENIEVLKNKSIIIKDLNDLNKLNPDIFEFFTLEYFRSKGYKGFKTQKSHDKGADVIVWKDNLKTVISSKFVSKPLSKKEINNVYYSKEEYKADYAIIFTNNTFTNQAEKFSKVFNVKLIDGHDIDKYLRKVNPIELTLKEKGQ